MSWHLALLLAFGGLTVGGVVAGVTVVVDRIGTPVKATAATVGVTLCGVLSMALFGAGLLSRHNPRNSEFYAAEYAILGTPSVVSFTDGPECQCKITEKQGQRYRVCQGGPPSYCGSGVVD
jgi:hypothetical protein